MKLLTITVPSYNSQDYLDKCIQSLLPGAPRVEIIIINDGSKDDTGKIADSYAQRYPDTVKVVHQENGGHGEGINQGLKLATGTYFKVVDSDDQLSDDLSAFLDLLEDCEAKGGADLVVTNYRYCHTDGKGDHTIRYCNALPADGIFGWEQTKRFRLHQLLTIHSCTFRTEVMRQQSQPLPKHVFYEDNLMVYQCLPGIRRLRYMDADLYRYTIGREGQSVQEEATKKRYTHQLLVNERCFQVCHLDDIQPRQLKQYMKHELFMLLAIGVNFTRLNRTKSADADLKKMWQTCKTYDKKWANYFRWRTPLTFLCFPGKPGQLATLLIYRIANKVIRFN